MWNRLFCNQFHKLSDDTRLHDLWGMNNKETGGTEDKDIDAPEWDITTGAKISQRVL